MIHLRPPRLASRRAMAELSRSAGSSRKSWGSQLSGIFSELLADPSDVFLATGRSGKHDEAALREIAMQKLSGSKLDPDILDSRREKVFIDEGVQILEENEQLVRRIRERMNRSGFFKRFLYFLSIFPNVWGLSSFHPNVSKQPPPPQCLGFCLLFTPRLLSRRAGSDVDATAAAHRTRKPRRCHVTTSHVDQHEEGHLQAQAGLLRQPVVRP